MCMKWLDTEKEKAIKVGTSWPYEKLNPYECVIADKFSSMGVSVGSKIHISLRTADLYNNMRF